MSEQDLLLLPPEIQAAYRDAKARGLPDGWTCTIDVRCVALLSFRLCSVLVDRLLWLVRCVFGS